MELRDFARQVLHSTQLERKLEPPSADLTDHNPGEATRAPTPGRPTELRIRPAAEVKVPPPSGLADPRQRPRILHALANHELQAAELFAWALLAFPQAPAEFRRGLAHILQDEQRHTRMYLARLEASGARFGDYPVSGYFWHKTPHLKTPLHFVCAMSLTFENANLDHTAEYTQAAHQAGDLKTAAVIERVGRDEIDHVRFGWTWLAHLKPPDQSMWQAFCSHLTWPLRPLKAKGRHFHPTPRQAAGLDPEFIRLLAESAE